MGRRGRRVHDEEPLVATRRRSAPSRDRSLEGPTGALLRLQALAGNAAVSTLMRAPWVQRDEGTAPAPTEERPKQSGIEIVVEDERIGSFFASSVVRSISPRAGGQGGASKQPHEFVITRQMDHLSPLLHRRAALGKPFPSVTIQFPGFPIVLKDVVISSYSVGTGAEPLESMTFSGKEPEEK